MYVGGQRGARTLYSKEIPLTPGPLVVAVKVALNQDPSDPSKYWPPSEPDQIETIAASYPPATGLASVRLFNLSPDTKTAGMTSDGAGAATISSVPYSLGSKWESFALGQQIFRIVDDFASPAVPVRRPSKPTPCSAGARATSKPTIRVCVLQVVSVEEAPAGPPIGSTMFLLGLRKQQGAVGPQALLLNDAPEGGVCKPEE